MKNSLGRIGGEKAYKNDNPFKLFMISTIKILKILISMGNKEHLGCNVYVYQ